MTQFQDLWRELFGNKNDVPETIPLRILGLAPPVPTREAIAAAFRRRVLEVHPDLQLADDQTRPEIRELVWARDVLVAMALPTPDSVTDTNPFTLPQFLPVTPTADVCRKCQRVLDEHERYYTYAEHSRRRLWCWRCVRADEAERAKARRRRRRVNRRCAQCAVLFTPARSDGRYCSPRCRQAAFRSRVTANTGTTMQPLLAVTADGDPMPESRPEFRPSPNYPKSAESGIASPT